MERVEYGTDGYPYKLSMSTGIENTEQYPTVEAIPKADYEARLKADIKAILVELQLEIEEIEKFTNTVGWELRAKTPEEIKKECLEIIQQKINALNMGLIFDEGDDNA